jgi:adenylate cyclase
MLAVFFSFSIQTFIQFMKTEKEKSYIRNAFSHYLSTDVINDLISDPSKLNLGGEKKILTALFTDVKGFSTVSEILDPTDLVKLLNQYLTEMSNIILSQRGTIDKYEGDAIISFFGSPVSFNDHAAKACISAVRMKRMEKILNEHFLSNKLSPVPLLTRVGINTGEMVVGNMGTLQKMDYTIMGNSVNLAARLEGVNKQYNTWVIISENTYEAAKGEGLVVRSLDRVRVVGIQKPVRLYELIEEGSVATPRLKEGIECFHKALDLFEKREWEQAEKGFQAVKQSIPDDGPSEIYIKRCEEYGKKPPASSWDGVFNLTTK